jgi:hypothetical protein
MSALEPECLQTPAARDLDKIERGEMSVDEGIQALKS